MTDWNNQVVRIESVKHHPNADRLDVVTVMGDYPIIVRRDEYKVGDTAAYIAIDSIVPDIDAYAFLSPKKYESYEENGEIKQRQLGYKYQVGCVPEKYRIIKAKRIYHVYSQGMLVPVPGGLSVGDSVVDALGLKKWEEPEQDDAIAAHTFNVRREANPRHFKLPYYDIEGLRKYSACLINDEEVVLTEKVNGSNSSYLHDGDRLWVKSRSFFRSKDEDCLWWDAAVRHNLEDKLAKYPMMAFYFELSGAIKKFSYGAELINGKLHTKLYCFDIYNTITGLYLDYDEFVRVADDLGLARVTELYRGPWKGKDMYQYAEGMSTLDSKTIREGFVVKPVVNRFNEVLGSRVILKLVGEGYNLKK